MSSYLPPDRFVDRTQTSAEQPTTSDCLFFNSLPTNPSIDQIDKALIAAVITAQQNAMPKFKRTISSSLFKNSVSSDDDAIETCYIFHTSNIIWALEDLFEGDATIKERLESIFDKPEVAHLDHEMLDKGFYHMGFIYAMFWYAITGTVANPSTCVSLNHLHAEEIEKTLHELDDELSGNSGQSKPAPAPKKSSSLPYWILMLVVGFIIGVIIKSCS